jgi:hypothetical protein
VYVSGPISKGDLAHNIQQGRDATIELMKAGYAVLLPHLTCFLESDTPCHESGFAHDVWMENDLPWVAVSHALLRLPGESKGADQETSLAKQLGIPVYTSMTNLLAELKPTAEYLVTTEGTI